MSAPEGQPTPRRRWRAPAIGALTGLAVAAAIVVPSALASGTQSSGACAAGKSARAAVASSGSAAGKSGTPAPGGVPHQFLDAVAQLQQAGTISAAQAQTLDTDIESGSINPKQIVADGVLTASQMTAVNDKLIAVKMGLAEQAHAQSSSSSSGSAGGG